jgi:hypothetical protein
LKVTIGALSLITPDPEEQIITILSIVEFDLYDPLSLKHDIALIQVQFIRIFFGQVRSLLMSNNNNVY